MDVIDAHCHIIAPGHPLTPNQGFVPETFTVEDYRCRTRGFAQQGFDVVGGVVVAGSFQGDDTGWLHDALERLGPDWAGVVNLAPEVTDEEIRRLDRVGARAVRINLYRSGTFDLDEAERLAHRVHDVAGWHTEFYLDTATLPDLVPLLGSLPQITVDHLGMSSAHEDALLSLVERGAVVKATGLGRIAVADPAGLVSRLLALSPTSVMFGTDLPSTRARRPFVDQDLLDVASWAGNHAADVLTENARRLYRLPRQ